MINTTDPAVIMEAVQKFVTRLAIGVVRNCHVELVDSTPVDTGWAKSNWQVTFGSPASDTVGSKLSIAGGVNDAALTALAGWRLETPAYIANNVPYIGILNDGWSAQAPAGFVEAAIEMAIETTIEDGTDG